MTLCQGSNMWKSIPIVLLKIQTIVFNLRKMYFNLQAYTKYGVHEKELAYRSGTNTLGIIFFCLTFGTVLGSLGKKGRVVIDFFHIIDEVIMKMVYGIMW